MNNRVCTCANNPKNSWPNLPHDSTCPLAEDQAQCPDCYTLGTMGPCKKHATLVQGRGGPARIENDSLCAACGHKALEHGTEGRCYFVDRTVEPIKRCHCDNFQTIQAEPIDELAKQTRPSKLDTLNEAFRRAYIECPAHVIDDLKRIFDDFLADALRTEGREIKNILHEVCQILAVGLAPGLARYAPLIARARELAHEGERVRRETREEAARLCEKWGQHSMADKLRAPAAREDLTRKKQE